MSPTCIDDEFIATWHPRYAERDEGEYQRLVSAARCEIRQSGTMTEQTFEAILRWKWAGLPAKIRTDNSFTVNGYRPYLNVIGKVAADNDNGSDTAKMRLLDALPFIGAPVASTLLAFIFPDCFPIFDRRTVDVLRYFGYISYKSTGLNQYPAFRKAVLGLRNAYPTWTLRQIDMAMFAFHKLNPSLFRRPCKALLGC